ncbi:MAG: LytR C-terminal domain-containing protein [Acidimicrobiales bacterium]
MSRRPAGPRAGSANPAGANSRGLVLLAVALLLGIVILNKTQADGASSTQVQTSTPRTNTTKPGRTTTTVPTATTKPARPPAQVKVLPANGSGVAGLGVKVGTRLKAANYNVLAAVNTTSGKSITTSSVEYAADFQPEAQALAQTLGLPASAAKPSEASPPISDTKGADIVVLIGPDLNTAAGATTTTGASTASTVRR